MQNESAETHLKALNQAWKTWGEHPDGANFHHLARELSLLLRAVVEEARSGKSVASFSAPLPLSPEQIRITVHFRHDGQQVIDQHLFARDFEEVVQDFQLHTLERYLRNPEFRITNQAFIRMGLALRAYCMERSMQRANRRLVDAQHPEYNKTEGENSCPGFQAVADSVSDSEENFLKTLKALWFHPYAEQQHGFPAKNAPGLSLRYLYVTLRVHSGASLKDIGRELYIHPSRFTHLKKELDNLLPCPDFGDWLPLGDFKPLKGSEAALVQLYLVGAYSRLGLLRLSPTGEIRRKILQRKMALWDMYIWAKEQRIADHGIENDVFTFGPPITKSNETERK